MKAIRFMKHYVTDGAIKARVFYTDTALVNGKRCVTLYARDYSRNLGKIFGDAYANATDYMTDYFDEGHVRIPTEHELYAAALARVRVAA